MISNDTLTNRFDLLYNNILSSQAPGLDEHEKSEFFNKAQLEVVKNKLNPKGNKYGEGIDESSKRQLEFSGLIKNTVIDYDDTLVADFCHNGVRFEFEDGNIPGDMLTILNEHVITSGRVLPVVPLNHMEYDTLMSRPFQMPPRSQAWRLFVDGHVEVVFNGTPNSETRYHVRYVKTPEDIDLTDPTKPCKLPDFLVDEVLQRAVELAKAAFEGDPNHQQLITTMGERSE